MRNLLIIISLLILTGCFPEDDPVIPLDIDIIEIPYSMYENQIWFNLKDKSIITASSNLDWDLGFESDNSGHHIILNTSRFMFAGNTGSTDFNGVTSNICDTMVYDDSNGDPDRTAIGEWADFSDPENPVYYREVYIIDLGYDNNGTPFGFRKIIFDRFENESYMIHFSNLDGSDEHNFQVPTDHERSFTLFSFSNGGSIVPLQPADSEWDVCFTQYSTILFDDSNVATPYLVRGIFINPAGTSASSDTTNSFYDITLYDVSDYTLSSNQDIIGYLWKDFENDSYKINPDIFYIIKDQHGSYFKLRFTGFYSSWGARGYVSFQLVDLSE